MILARDRAPQFPQSDHSLWEWRSWEGLPYLTCSLLDNWRHGFFTQQCSPKVPTELVKALQPEAPVYRVKQVHGNAVLKTSEVNHVSETEPHLSVMAEADGLVAEGESEAVWVCTADCVPVLIADPETGQVAAVHAGWRGTAAKIVPEAVAKLTASGSQLHNLSIALGPAIAGEVYQVSTEVAVQLGTTIAPAEGVRDATEILSFVHQLPNSPILPDPEPGKVRVDVRRFNALQLEQLGIHPQQVAIAPYCTYQTTDYFFSYRRDPNKKVQWSGIVSGKP